MRPFFLLVLSVFGAGCSASHGNLKKTAAVDLSCPPKQLEVDELDKTRAGAIYLVTGCGRSAQYTVNKKATVRTSEVMAAAPRAAPPPVVAPMAEPAQPNAQQQANFNAFMAEHDQSFAQQEARQKAFFATPAKPPPSVAPRPSPAAATAPTAQPDHSAPPPASATASASQAGYVCLNGAYHSCPTPESTAALAVYAKCRFDCMMSGDCSKCDVGPGRDCTRDSSRDPSCK
jgi:hypothetical protein